MELGSKKPDASGQLGTAAADVIKDSGTATFATYNNVLWSQTTPLTAGANWGEWFTPGFELNVSAGTVAITYQIGSGGSPSGVNLVPELVISE
mgnify:CR=1 FL=1